MLRRYDVPEERQRIFQSHAAALEETSTTRASAWRCPSPSPTTSPTGVWCDLRAGRERGRGVEHHDTARPQSPTGRSRADAVHLHAPGDPCHVARLGINIGHFRPSVYVTLWS